MKWSVAFALFVLASCSAGSVRISPLAQDLKEFSSLIPQSDIIAIALKYYTSDAEFRNFIVYVTGEESKESWRQVFGHREIRKIIEYLEAQGVNAIATINSLADLAGLPHYPSSRAVNPTGGVRGFFDAVEALIPREKLKKLFYEKLENSQAFKDLYHKVAAFNYKEFFQFVENSKEMTGFLNKLRGYGLNVDGAIEKLRIVFQWN